jgi:hypothetical protein
MNFARHEEKCRRLSEMATSSTRSDMFRITEDDSFELDQTPESDPFIPNTENINDLGLLMSPTISLRAKHLLMLRHFFGVPTDIPRTQTNQKSNKYLEMHRIVRGLPKVSSVIAVTSTNNSRNLQSSQIDPDVLRMISELCPTEGKLKTLSSILERSHILESSPSLKLSMLQLKNRSTHPNFSCVKVWEDRFFYFRRLDDVLGNEVFGDVLVDSRLTWGHPGRRMKRFERSIQLQYPGCTPVGLASWSDSASPSIWSAVSFHQILVRLTNEPADKYTLVEQISGNGDCVREFGYCLIEKNSITCSGLEKRVLDVPCAIVIDAFHKDERSTLVFLIEINSESDSAGDERVFTVVLGMSDAGPYERETD